MSERWTVWWRERSLREQRLLLAMFATIGVVVLWFGIIMPINDARIAAYARHDEAVTALGRVRADAVAVRALSRNRPAPLDAPLQTVVGNLLASAGFENASVAPQGAGRVTVSIAAARPNALFGAVADMEARGIIVERLSARANTDQTLSVEMTLLGRAS